MKLLTCSPAACRSYTWVWAAVLWGERASQQSIIKLQAIYFVIYFFKEKPTLTLGRVYGPCDMFDMERCKGSCQLSAASFIGVWCWWCKRGRPPILDIKQHTIFTCTHKTNYYFQLSTRTHKIYWKTSFLIDRVIIISCCVSLSPSSRNISCAFIRGAWSSSLFWRRFWRHRFELLWKCATQPTSDSDAFANGFGIDISKSRRCEPSIGASVDILLMRKTNLIRIDMH